MEVPQTREWVIRRASEHDSSAISSLHTALNRPTRGDSVFSEYFVASTPKESIVGCAAVRKSERIGYLYGLGVDKAWRRRGIGHALTQERLDWLKANGANTAYVLAMFWNIRFFKKHGFQLADRTLVEKLKDVHNDFSEQWSSRSALLVFKFHSCDGKLIRHDGQND